MDSSSGLGRPGPGQPEFDRPVDGTRAPDLPPAQFGAPGSADIPGGNGTPRGPWAPPPLAPSGQPPYGQPPAPPRAGRRRTGAPIAVLGTALVSVVALGLLAWQLLPAIPLVTPAPTTTTATSSATVPATAPPSVVRTPATPLPTTTAAVTGGSIGQRIQYRSSGGEAQVTVTRAGWADNGELPPSAGLHYLVLDVRFEALDGVTSTGPFFTAVREPGGERQLIAVGAALSDPLTMRTLSAGQDNTGQVAFEVARGPVTFEVLDELLEPIASVEIPG